MFFSAVSGGEVLVHENELKQMKQVMDALNNANIHKEAVIDELENRLNSVIRMNEALAYKVTQFQSLDFDKCLNFTNEDLADRILDLQRKRSFFVRPPTWMVYSTSSAIVPVFVLARYFLNSWKLRCILFCFDSLR